MRIEDVTITFVSGNDIDRLCDFEEQARQTEPDIWISEFNKTKYKEKLISINLDNLPNNKILVASYHEQVIARCDIMVIFSLFDFYKQGYIDWIYTLKDYRGNGIGKKLLKEAENYFKSIGVSNYYLFTASNDQAKEFYHKQVDFQFTNKEVAEKEIK